MSFDRRCRLVHIMERRVASTTHPVVSLRKHEAVVILTPQIRVSKMGIFQKATALVVVGFSRGNRLEESGDSRSVMEGSICARENQGSGPMAG